MPPTNAQLAEILKRAPLFTKLAEPELLSLGMRARFRQYARNELLFSEGDPCSGLYVVASGLIRIFKASSSGREHVLSVEGPGASFAELPVFDGGPYPASAVAAADSEVLFLSTEDFRLLCLDRPEIALRVLEVVGARLRHLVSIVEELSFTTVRQRLIRYVLKRAKAEGSSSAAGPKSARSFMVEDNYHAIAAEIGTVRDLVSRNLARLQSEGLLKIAGREIIVPDVERLREELPR